MTLNRDASDYELTLFNTTSGLTPATTNPIVITPIFDTATATSSFSVPTTPVVAGTPFTVVVTAKDFFGDVDSAFNNNITIAMGANAAGSTLSGQTTTTALNGVATL